jgi:hypothetical protein
MSSFPERVIGAAKFDPVIYDEIKNDPQAMKQGLALILAVGILFSLGAAFEDAVFETDSLNPATILLGTLALAVFLGLEIAFYYVLGARWLPHPEPAPTFVQFFRTVSFSLAPGLFYVAGVFPGTGYLVEGIVSLWCLAALWAALRVALGYRSLWHAVGLTLLAALVVAAPGFILIFWFTD